MRTQLTFLLRIVLPLVLLGCKDVTAPRLDLPHQPFATRINVVARLDCTVDIRAETTNCKPPAPERNAGGARLGLLGNGEVKLRSYNVQYDSLTEIFQADINIENWLPEVIGTPDGTTPTGIRIFHHQGPTVTSYAVEGSTDQVTVHNADGYRYFTNPNQPYFQYDTILATYDTSRTKLWQWKAPKTVKTFSFVVMVEADLPSEARVPGMPPDTVPHWIYAAENIVSGVPYVAGELSKDIVVVAFKPYTTQPRRRAAIDSINGTVIGGQRFPGGDGLYYVQVPGDGTAGPAYHAVEKLKTLPQVIFASEEFVATDVLLSSVRPDDGARFQQWQVRVTGADGENWGPEAVAAPLAWGCSRGDTAAIAVVDHDFHSAADLTANQHPTLGVPHFGLFVAAQDTVDHGTKTASIIGARGDNASGITGMMWNARLRMYEAAADDAGNTKPHPTLGYPRPYRLYQRIVQAGMDGAAVINISWGFDWELLKGKGYNPAYLFPV